MSQHRCHHFALADIEGSGHEADLPMLLRHMADEIERAGIESNEVLDLTVRGEMTAGGQRWSMTVYY